MISLFDCISTLFWSCIDEGNYVQLGPKLIEHCTFRSGAYPPCESTITLHELMHCYDQIPAIDPNRYSTLFKYERMNLLLKVTQINVKRI